MRFVMNTIICGGALYLFVVLAIILGIAYSFSAQ